jgi:hypothetical protein
MIDATAYGRLTKASVVGGLRAEAVRRIIRSRFEGPNRCFAEGFRRKPQLAGTVQLRFTILPSGEVTKLRLLTTLLDEKVVECIENEVAKWRFPPVNERPTRVVYPLLYHPCHHGPVHDALLLPWIEGGRQGPPPKVPECGSAESARLLEQIVTRHSSARP